jgi:serine/threonine protein kinase
MPPEGDAKDRSDSISFFRRTEKEKLEPAPGLTPGKIVGDFRLDALIGQGGMGQVWEAEQLSLKRAVAVKFVRPERVTAHQLELFAREARAGGRLHHPGIVAIHGHGQSDGLAWIAMEFVSGAWTLKDFLDEAARLPEVPEGYDGHVARFVAEIAEAMQAAHEGGVIHRDLKPQNVLITADDHPKVTDFGLARITDEAALSVTGDFAGTYFYMSPEQAMAKRMGLDHRTDVFSLGVVLYELLALRRPFEGDTSQQVVEQIMYRDPADPRTIRSKIPRDLAVIAGKALEKERHKRYGTMRELAADLRRHLADEPIHARPPTRIDRTLKWIKRNPGKSSAAAIVAVALLVISALLFANVRANRALARSNTALEAKTTES